MIPPRWMWELFPKAHQARWAMASFRGNMAWWGCPMDHLTDDEILESLDRMAVMVANCGVTTAQAAAAMNGGAAAARKMPGQE